MGVSCLFVFAHSQYLSLDAYNLGMVASLFCLSIGFGVIFATTRSLLPSVIAHALINVPMTPLWQGICLAGFVSVTLVAWRRGRERMRHAFLAAPALSCLALGLVGAIWAMATRRFDVLEYVAVGAVVGAVALHAIERRRKGA